MTENTKINVLHLIATNFIGGPEKQILKHLEHVDAAKYDVSVCSFIERHRPNELLEKLKQLNRPAYQVNHPFLFDLSTVKRLKGILIESRSDILISHGYKSNILGYHASRALSIPQAMYVRGWTSENWHVKLYNRIERRYLRKADLIVTVSRNKINELVGFRLEREKLRFIANAVDIPDRDSVDTGELRRRYGLSGETALFLAAGRLSPEKGHEQLLYALDRLSNEKFDFCCVIFGSGQLEHELKELATRLGLETKVKFAGFDKDWKKYLAEADLVINPSLSEVMPNVVLESMAARVPVVATDVGGVNELITNGETGFLAEPGKPEALYAAIMSFVDNKDRISELTEKGYAHIKEHFSFQQQAQKLQSLYDELFLLKAKR